MQTKLLPPPSTTAATPPGCDAGGSRSTESGDCVRIEAAGVVIERLLVTDPAVIAFTESLPADRMASELARALAVGVRGLTTMGVGVTVADVGREVERALAEVAETARLRVSEIMDSSRRVLTESLDPDLRSSMMARTLEEVAALHADLLARLDPEHGESHAGRLVARLDAMLGPGGMLETRLMRALDPSGDGSPLASLAGAIEGQIRDLRDLVVADRSRSSEAERGTAKGVEFEDVVELRLRETARRIGGCAVERTGRETGSLGSTSVVGDFVLALPDGMRIVVEAKNTASIGLTGKHGILDELDRAMANRGADFAICVSRIEAYPGEVGAFGAYGNRLLVVDDGDGTLLDIAVRWGARVLASSSAPGPHGIDPAFVVSKLDRIRDLTRHFARSKKALTAVRSSIDIVRGELDELRSDLLDLVDDLAMEVGRPSAISSPPDSAVA